jgi:hypothetical protein
MCENHMMEKDTFENTVTHELVRCCTGFSPFSDNSQVSL